MSDPLPDLFLSRDVLRRLAGDEHYTRGEEHWRANRVAHVQFRADRATGKVAETRAWRATLWLERGEIRFRCGCPSGNEPRLCEHGVAVGLAWVEVSQRAGSDRPEAPTSPAPGNQAHRASLAMHLRKMGRDRLVELLLEATDYDDILRRRLLLESCRVAGPAVGKAPPDLAAYRELLREAIATTEYVDYDALPDYVQGVSDAVLPLAGLLDGGYASAVIELAELALVELGRAGEYLDTGDESLNAVYDDLQRWHLEACRVAQPEPTALARRLLEYEFEGGLGVFNNAVNHYAEIFGPAGITAWREALFQAWSGLQDSGQSSARDKASAPAVFDHRRFQIETLAASVFAELGDKKAGMALKRGSLSTAHDYAGIAEAHIVEGQLTEAIRWAELGRETFASQPDVAGLTDLLVKLYAQTAQPEKALQLRWAQFSHQQSLENYGELKSAAEHTEGGWPPWRQQALELTRTQLRALAASHKERAWPNPPDFSRVVELLLWERATDEAWENAQASGCRPDLWRRLADARAEKHPVEALAVYESLLTAILAQGGLRAYQEAIVLLNKITAILQQAGRSAEIAAYWADVRSLHRHRRSFVKLLDAAQGG